MRDLCFVLRRIRWIRLPGARKRARLKLQREFRTSLLHPVLPIDPFNNFGGSRNAAEEVKNRLIERLRFGLWNNSMILFTGNPTTSGKEL